MRNRIMPNDTVKHRPSGETWVVCGVNHESGSLVPMGYPFPSIANVEDCELIKRRYETEPQSEEQIKAMRLDVLMDSCISIGRLMGFLRREE